jgi:hypothetical protein
MLGRISPRNVSALAIIPLAAFVVYAPIRGFGLTPPTNLLLYVVTMPLGFWFFGVSLRRLLRARE